MPSEQDIAFPVLGDSELETLARRGHRRSVRVGDVLFAAGDSNF
jgi:hypothetical protein